MWLCNFRATALALHASLLLPLSLSAQVLTDPVNRLYSAGGELQGGNARSVVSIGDINGDGIPDFAVSLTNFSTLGRVQALSGKNGSSIWNVTAHTSGTLGNRAMASLGDINNDGVSDLIIGAPSNSNSGLNFNGRAEVRSGVDGALLFAFNGTRASGYFGSSVVATGDLNNDGTPDTIVCARGFPEATTPPSISYCRAFSLSNGTLLWEKLGGLRDGMGTGLAAINDVNNDGKRDLIISSPLHALGLTNTQEGRLELISGANGNLITVLNGSVPYAQLGKVVSSVGDLNGDGKTEFVVTSNSGYAPASATVYSILNGQITPRFQLPVTNPDLVQSISSIVDLSRDGTRDIALGFPYAAYGNSNVGLIRIFSGSDGQQLKIIDGDGYANNFGTSLTEIGDINLDGDPEFAVLAMDTAQSGGSISLFSVGNKNRLLTGCGQGAQGSLQIQGVPVPGNTVTFEATLPLAANGVGGFWASLKSHYLATSTVQFNPGEQCRTGLDLYQAQSSPFQLVDSNGRMSFPFAIPANPTLIGTEIIVEGWFVDQTGRVHSTPAIIMQVQ